MFLKTLRSDKNYSGYVFRRFFPYTLIMTFTLLAINVLVYSLSSYRVGQSLYLIDISIPTQIFMYIMPVILGCAQFRFLFTRNGSDFYGAMPATRAEIFNSNIVSGLASIFIIIGVNTVFFAINMPLVHPNTMIAPTAYLWYFFYWFVAYAVTFAVTAFAATLSGTVLAQLILTFVTIITPGFFITAFQIVCGSNIGSNMSDNIITAESADILIKVLFAPYYPIQQLFFLFFNYQRYTGMFYDIQTFPMLICNVVMLFVFIYAGSKLLRRRKFELAGGAYASEKLYSAVKILAVFPFIFVMFRVLADAREFYVFLLFMIMITVFYILMDICLRKGLTKIKLSLVTYLVSFAFTFVVFFGFSGIESLIYKSNIYVPQADISSVTVYMEPVGLSYEDDYVPVTKGSIPVKLSDEQLITEFKNSATLKESNGRYMIMRLNVNGKTLLGRYYVSGRFIKRLYQLIESDEELMAKLDYTEKRKTSPLLTSVSTRGSSYIGSYYRGGYNGFKISSKEAQDGLLALLDAQNAKETLVQRYNASAYVDDGVILADVYTSDSSVSYGNSYAYVTDSSQENSAHFVSYINGVYYTESFKPDTKEEYESFCKYMNLNAAEFSDKDPDRLSVYLNTDTSKAISGDFLGSSGVFSAVCNNYEDEILAAVRKNEYVPEYEDTVMVQINDSWGGFVYAAVSYKDTVKPLVEKYLANSLAFAENFDYYAAPEFTVRIYPDGINGTQISVAHYYSAVRLQETFEKLIPYCVTAEELYTADGHLADNVDGRGVIEIKISNVNLNLYHLYAYITEETEKFFTDKTSDLYSKEYDTRLTIKNSDVVTLILDGNKITDPEDIEYFRPYIVTMLTSGNYTYEYMYEVECEITLQDPNDPEITTTHNTWLPMTEEMLARYKQAVNLTGVK